MMIDTTHNMRSVQEIIEEHSLQSNNLVFLELRVEKMQGIIFDVYCMFLVVGCIDVYWKHLKPKSTFLWYFSTVFCL